jgi:MFS superfamily sulfate permease-like transporter
VDSVVDGSSVPGLVVYRFDGPLFFANAQLLADDLEAAVGEGTGPEPVRWVVVDAESIGDVDSTGAGMLADLADGFRERGITLSLARVKSAVAAYLDRAGVLAKVGAERVYLEVDDAVAAYQASRTAGATPGTTR